MLIDSFGRTITYLRISLTDKCNYRCVYCMPDEGIELKPHNQILRYEEIEDIARTGAELGIKKIRLTGGEPLVKRNVVDLVARIGTIKQLEEVTMTTNGSLLTLQLARKLKDAGLGRINISLDTLAPDVFHRITRGGNITDVFRGIDAALTAGLTPIKINMVIFENTKSAEVQAMRNYCGLMGLTLQTIKQFSLYDRKDPAGASSADRPPKCATCNRLRITADGYFKPCLFSSHEIKIDLTDIRSCFFTAVAAKPENGEKCKNRTMRQIGG